MANVRDPAFWKRFSTAVHLDEESTVGSSASTTSRPELKHQDSWLASQQRKRSKRTCICWSFWLGTIGLVAAVVIVVLWLIKSGTMSKLQQKIESVGS